MFLFHSCLKRSLRYIMSFGTFFLLISASYFCGALLWTASSGTASEPRAKRLKWNEATLRKCDILEPFAPFPQAARTRDMHLYILNQNSIFYPLLKSAWRSHLLVNVLNAFWLLLSVALFCPNAIVQFCCYLPCLFSKFFWFPWRTWIDSTRE